jgi:DGQHR domain-containing protein
MAKLSGIREIELYAQLSKNLDTMCYRGSAPLSHLALISQVDIFDTVSNPNGLQRDLSTKHASDAYEYANRDAEPNFPRAYPEVILNVRDKKTIQIEEVYNKEEFKIVRLRFDLDKMKSENKIFVSRVDGNHRLFYSLGDDKKEPILTMAPFQMHIGLTSEQERSLFVDINANQKGLNTSHLAVMRSRLTPEEEELRDHLDRWIATKLANDPGSPWHGIVHLGGSKEGARSQGLVRQVNLASLQLAIKKTLTKSQYIHDFTDANLQYLIIKNYWEAVKNVFSEEWGNPKDFLFLKNVGVLSYSILGGTIIDRCVPRGKVDIKDFIYYLSQTRNRFNWSKKATGESSVVGMGGNKAAMVIAGALATELTDETGESVIKELQEKLRAKSQLT